MTTRQENEAREAQARDNADGWVSEFVAWIPWAIGITVVMAIMMYGMLGIEVGFDNLF